MILLWFTGGGTGKDVQGRNDRDADGERKNLLLMMIATKKIQKRNGVARQQRKLQLKLKVICSLWLTSNRNLPITCLKTNWKGTNYT